MQEMDLGRAALEALPHRPAVPGQWLQITHFRPGLVRLMKVGATGGEQVSLHTDLRQLMRSMCSLPAGNDLQTAAAGIQEIIEQGGKFCAREFVLERMGQYGETTRVTDPVYDLR